MTNKKLIPLSRVVSSAMVDSYKDVSKAGVYQMYQHWAARGLRKLVREVLKTGKKSATIYVNPRTKTGTLPPDFDIETFVGVINNYGEKVPIPVNHNLIDESSIQDLSECTERCAKCNQNKAICQDLEVTEDTTVVVINGENYNQTVIKKLYPNGDYYLESVIPVLNQETEIVEYDTQKDFIAKISLKPCGCIEETDENIEVIRCVNYDVYCTYYAPCCAISVASSYQIFPETGLIVFNSAFPFTRAYLEYRGFMPKKNGQYLVPEAAEETLVEYIKFKEIDNKPNVPNSDKIWRLERFNAERKNMMRSWSPLSLSELIYASMLLPQFDWIAPSLNNYCCGVSAPSTTSSSSSSGSTGSQSSTTNGSASKSYIPFSIAVIAGSADGTPTEGEFTYQNDKLIGAIGVNFIIVNNSNETIKAGEFSLNTDTGVLTRTNQWFNGDVLIIPTFFKYM